MSADTSGARQERKKGYEDIARNGEQEWASMQDSEMSIPQSVYNPNLLSLIAALKSGLPTSGNQVAEVLEAIVQSFDSRLNAQQQIIKSQQEELVRVHKQTTVNRADIMSIVEQTNTKLKEHLTKLNDKVKKIKREGTVNSLARSRTSTTMSRGRGSTMALGASNSHDSARGSQVPFTIKDSTDSHATSRFDDPTSPTRTCNPFRITATEETVESDEPNNRPLSDGEGEQSFDIDAPDDQALMPSASCGSKTPAPDVIGRSGSPEDCASNPASPSRTPRAVPPLGGLGSVGALADGARQMADEAMGMVRVPTMMSTLSSDSDEDENMYYQGKLIAVTSSMLDKGDMYRSNSSVWDSMFFFLIPAVGPPCSVLVGICWLMNIFLQVAFIYVVEVMLDEDQAISPEVLQGLLQFRLGAAHHADYADRVSQQSMAAQVCSQESKLHLAGGQQDLYSNISKFSEQQAWLAETLVMLIQFLWASTVLRDINNTVTIFRGLKGILRSRRSSRLFLADLQDSDSDDDKENGVVKTKSKTTTEDACAKMTESSRTSQLYQKSGTFLRSLIEQDHGEDELAHSNLISIMKVVRWTRIWYGRFYAVCLLVCCPKIILAGVLWWVGAKWLAHTISLTELILNGVALAFVLDFDECIFDIFVPRRVKILVNNLEPLPLMTRNARGGTQLSVINSMLKIGGAFLVLVLLYLWMDPLVFWQLRQAEMIMCQGQTDFIYTVNPATGLVHVAKTPSRTEWTQSEYTVAGVAQPPLLDPQNYHWEETDITEEMFAHSSVDSSRAVFEPRAPSLAAAVANDDSFKRIIQMSSWSVADAAASLPCEDLAENLNVAAATMELRLVTGISDLTNCSEVPLKMCSDQHMYQLRALCPKTCECDATFLTTGSGRVGFFGTPGFGCPTQCSTFRAAENEIRFRFDMAQPNWPRFTQCTDFDVAQFTFPGNCSSSNRDDHGVEVFDRYFFDCAEYERIMTANIGRNDQICATAAGVWEYGVFAERDDGDFTASEMCCICGGGKYNVKSSAECWDEWTNDCTDMPRENLAWFRYVQGLFQYLYSRPGFEDGVRNVVKEDYVGISPSERQAEVILDSITLGWFFRMLATTSNWEIAPGVPHPRGLTGCEFLASYEIASLLNLDLCNPVEGTSIKSFCPSACQCTEASSLTECPAKCVFTDCDGTCRHVHPWYSEDGADYVGETLSTTASNGTVSCEDTVPVNATKKCPNGTNFDLCHDNDDETFVATVQCCACGGGSFYNPCHNAYSLGSVDANGRGCRELQSYLDAGQTVNCSADDDDFTASEMCCACSGGSETAAIEFTILIDGMDLDDLSIAQQSDVTRHLKDLVLQTILDYSPSSTIDDVQMELHQGSVMACTRILFREFSPQQLFFLERRVVPVVSGASFSSSVKDAIVLVDGLDTSQLSVSLYGSILYGGVEEGSPLDVPMIDHNCTCDCVSNLNSNNQPCQWYNGYSEDVLEISCYEWDDDDFTAVDMCCACSGMVLEEDPCVDTAEEGAFDLASNSCKDWDKQAEYCSYAFYYDSEDFSAQDMCCACGGGQI